MYLHVKPKYEVFWFDPFLIRVAGAEPMSQTHFRVAILKSNPFLLANTSQMTGNGLVIRVLYCYLFMTGFKGLKLTKFLKEPFCTTKLWSIGSPRNELVTSDTARHVGNHWFRSALYITLVKQMATLNWTTVPQVPDQQVDLKNCFATYLGKPSGKEI